jgi:hypothetical protein
MLFVCGENKTKMYVYNMRIPFVELNIPRLQTVSILSKGRYYLFIQQ